MYYIQLTGVFHTAADTAAAKIFSEAHKKAALVCVYNDGSLCADFPGASLRTVCGIPEWNDPVITAPLKGAC